VVRDRLETGMRRRTKTDERSQSRNLLIVWIVALAVVILLLRMMLFVAGHGRHHF
jgi:hypothetical protein